MDYKQSFHCGKFSMLVIKFKVFHLYVFDPGDVFFLCLLKKCIFHYLINYNNTNKLYWCLGGNCFEIVIILSYSLLEGIKLDVFQFGFRLLSVLRPVPSSYMMLTHAFRAIPSPPLETSPYAGKIQAVKTRLASSLHPLPSFGSICTTFSKP